MNRQNPGVCSSPFLPLLPPLFITCSSTSHALILQCLEHLLISSEACPDLLTSFFLFIVFFCLCGFFSPFKISQRHRLCSLVWRWPLVGLLWAPAVPCTGQPLPDSPTAQTWSLELSGAFHRHIEEYLWEQAGRCSLMEETHLFRSVNQSPRNWQAQP